MTTMPTFTVGDTARDLTGKITSAGNPVALDTATALAVHVRRRDKTVVSNTATVDAAAGVGCWRMVWQAGDLSISGMYEYELEVTWGPGRIETFGPGSFMVREQIA